MNTLLLLGYAAVALVFWVHTLNRLLSRRRPERLFGLEEDILLVAVAVLASAAWVLLIPFYAIGWAHWAYEHRGYRDIDRLWSRGRRHAALPVRPAQRAA